MTEPQRPTRFLNIDEVVELARRMLGDPPPIRDLGLLGSAVSRPQTTLFGEDAYEDLWTKAAALFQSLVGNHALIDGNKRLGWASTAVFLELNGVRASDAPDDDVYELVIEVASTHQTVEHIADRLRTVVGATA